MLPKIAPKPRKIGQKPPTTMLCRRSRKRILLKKKCKSCNGCWNQKELEHMLPVPMTMRTVVASHRTTGTSLIIVVRLHAFKTTAQLLSALAQKFQLRRKARRVHWSILDWGLWDGLRTGVLEIVLLL